MSRTPPRRADSHMIWLRAQYKEKTCYRPEGPITAPPLGALTGTDFACLEAIDRMWNALNYADNPECIIRAIALVALEMQKSTRPLAREVIPHSKDWSDRERYWPRVELEMQKIESERDGDTECGPFISAVLHDAALAKKGPP